MSTSAFPSSGLKETSAFQRPSPTRPPTLCSRYNSLARPNETVQLGGHGNAAIPPASRQTAEQFAGCKCWLLTVPTSASITGLVTERDLRKWNAIVSATVTLCATSWCAASKVSVTARIRGVFFCHLSIASSANTVEWISDSFTL
jgi:hypothetical protein